MAQGVASVIVNALSNIATKIERNQDLLVYISVADVGSLGS